MTQKPIFNLKNSLEESIITSENNFIKFQTNITRQKILDLNKEFKKYEKKGYVSYFKFILSMKSVFDNKNLEINKETLNSNLSINSNSYISSNLLYDDIYNLFFKRFREIKCIIKNNKDVFYLTEFKNENYISTFKVLYALTIFLFAKIDMKLELLFKLTDMDEDGLLNKREIKYMISTVNHIFVEETDTLKMNSSILSQSLKDIKVENILKELFEGKGNLNNVLEENGNYIDFNTFYKNIINIKNYKNEIIPNFINFKNCLFNKRKENIIKVKAKNKNDFINISSTFKNEQSKNASNFYKFRKKYATMDISDILQPVEYNEKNKKKEKTFIKSRLSLKSIIKNCSTMLETTNKKFNRSIYNDEESELFNSLYLKNTKFAFQANLGDIRSMEVEPGIIQIIPDEDKKNDNFETFDIKELFNNKKDNTINSNSILDINSLKQSKKLFKKKISKNKVTFNLRKNLLNSVNKSNKNELSSISNSSRISRPYKVTKNKSNIQNIVNSFKKTNNKMNINKYKTLEEIMKEIKVQEDVFNGESINFINYKMLKESEQSELLMKKVKNTFLYRKERPKQSSSFFGILYKRGNLSQIFKPKKKKSNF